MDTEQPITTPQDNTATKPTPKPDKETPNSKPTPETKKKPTPKPRTAGKMPKTKTVP